MPDVMKKQIYVWKIKTALTCFQAQLSVIQDPMWCWSWWSTDLLDWWSPTGESTKLNTGKTHLPLEPFSTQCSHTKTDVITKRGKSLKKPMINQSEPCKLPEARENARGQGVFGFSLPSDFLRGSHELSRHGSFPTAIGCCDCTGFSGPLVKAYRNYEKKFAFELYMMFQNSAQTYFAKMGYICINRPLTL